MSPADAFNEILASHRLPEYASIIGRRLQEERERCRAFYADMTDEVKMEFIDGDVVMHSPAKNRHLMASGNLFTLLHLWAAKIGGLVHVEKALCVFTRNDYEPDIVYFGPEKNRTIRPDTMKFPVPDFVVEILSESTEHRDRGVKFEDYASHGVQEYWIVDPDEESIEQYLLTSEDTYKLRMKASAGEISSTVIVGFTILIRAVFDAEANRLALAKLMQSR
ncbi:MAG TPA: Uma2 family endonuclease [Planctomycetaceae bacterium]|nr:Uma2 family endonuclease [Planctomycetaceae bacterium]